MAMSTRFSSPSTMLRRPSAAAGSSLTLLCVLLACCGGALATLNAQICPSQGTPSCGVTPLFPAWQSYQQPGCMHTSTYVPYQRCYAMTGDANQGQAYRPTGTVTSAQACSQACVGDKRCLAWDWLATPNDRQAGCWLIRIQDRDPNMPTDPVIIYLTSANGGASAQQQQQQQQQQPANGRRLQGSVDDDWLFPPYQCVPASQQYNGGALHTSGEVVRTSSTFYVYQSFDSVAPYNNKNNAAPCTDNAIKCMSLCQKQQGGVTHCTGWTWNLATKKCFLFNSASLTFSAQQATDKCMLYSGKVVDCAPAA